MIDRRALLRRTWHENSTLSAERASWGVGAESGHTAYVYGVR